ncbi:hypothetical protein O181_016895 [Austropuccinia psidii MF-1]|uniref:Uncharacterized protein n=1 Tax=Austropuccinia psidii MF-1 TaxID=1389203 RepID=A0A9Q3C6S7_9BASI|nr:hypothetical protein [Austropuccinia psidii MF-1]
MSSVHLRNLGIPMNQPKDRKGLFKTRRSGYVQHGQNTRWQDTEETHTHTAIHPPIQWEPQTRGLEGYGSSSSAPPIHLRFIVMEHVQRGVKSSITLGRTWSKFPEYMSQRNTLQRSYGNDQRMELQQAVKTPEERATRIRENKATIQGIEKQLNQTEPNIIPSGSQGVNQPESQVASHHSGTNRSVTRGHPSSQSQVVSKRRQG